MSTMSTASIAAGSERDADSASAELAVEPLLARVREYNADADLGVLRRAFELAAGAHEGQLRVSGAPYLEHPLAVAHILADLHSDVPTLAAGLLHDVVEDTSVSLAAIRRQFDPEIALLVDGVTKLSQTDQNRRRLARAAVEPEEGGLEPRPERQRKQAANIRKIFVAMAKDVRVMLI